MLANAVTMETGVGSADCPWIIQVQPGQTINVTLHDFERGPQNSDICYVYATLKEAGRMSRSVTVCGGEERTRHVYTTTSNTLEIRMLGSNQRRHFLLEYSSKE